MSTTTVTPLTEAEFDRLQNFLASLPAGAMNIEELDGFFAGLICSPVLITADVWLSIVWGEEALRSADFADQGQAQDILALLTRHWNAVTESLRKTLRSDADIHLPVLLEDEAGVAHGNDWARGFTRAMHLSPDGWDQLLDDGEQGGAVIPMMVLAHEHDDDPETRSPAIPADKRDELLQHLIAGLMHTYRYFEPQRRAALLADKQGATFRRTQAKVGRNDPCPCNSGRKFKLCCGKSDAVQR
ncbi:MAG: UPF0149 family protein [Leptothrix sp. (in: b-proteobacteria)]